MYFVSETQHFELSRCVTPYYKPIWLIKKWNIPVNLCCLSLTFTLGEVFIHMYFISWEKSKRFHRKVNSRSFRWLPAAILVDRFDPPTWRLPTKLFEVAWNASTNNSQTSYRTDRRIGELVYKSVSYNNPSSCLFSLNGFKFISLLRDSENDVYAVSVCITFFFALAWIRRFPAINVAPNIKPHLHWQVFLHKSLCQGKLASVNEALQLQFTISCLWNLNVNATKQGIVAKLDILTLKK